MKRKTLLALVLVVLMCFGFNLAALAASPKDLVMTAIDKMDFAASQKDLSHLSGNITLTVDKLDGDGVKDINIPAGTSLSCNYKLNVPGQKAVADLKLNYNNKTYSGQAYLTGDKLIITKSLMTSLTELAVAGDPEYQDQLSADQSQLPDYLYLANEQGIKPMWASLLNASSQSANVIKEEKELFKFILEAVPAKYFSVSGGSVVLNLDQDGFLTTVNAVLQKIANEGPRFADIMVNIAAANPSVLSSYGDSNGATAADPEQMKQEMKAEIIAGIQEAVQDGTWPTADQVKSLGDLIQIKQFKCQASILPGGPKGFDVSIALKPASGLTGQIDLRSNSTGSVNNLTGNSLIKLQLKDATDPDNNSINGALESKYKMTAPQATTNAVLSAVAQMDGVKELDLMLSLQATEKLKDNSTINVPVLTKANSMDLQAYFNNLSAPDGADQLNPTSPDSSGFDLLYLLNNSIR